MARQSRSREQSTGWVYALLALKIRPGGDVVADVAIIVDVDSACLRRVQAPEKAGVIRAYRAVLDPEKLGFGFLAYVTVGLNAHTKAAQESFERAVARAPQVRECHNITGTVEYLLRVETADLAAYKHWHTDVLGILPQVRSITTFVVMGSPKDERA